MTFEHRMGLFLRARRAMSASDSRFVSGVKLVVLYSPGSSNVLRMDMSTFPANMIPCSFADVHAAAYAGLKRNR